MSSSFHIWAEMVRGLQRRLLEEIVGDERTWRLPRTCELVEQLAGLAHYCDETAHLVDSLEAIDRRFAEAYARALKKT
jgi:hypothetical protein